ncbi:hypothetical protein DFP75_11067 [Marinomonas alcarazii]|uniref:Uncharacterized protein n=1 Tax=Marinomonas alcarazii TaxID=491949 RepID=A0A318UQY6_9GAMM|nr:hypothetical protein [Marinomonas alcarazii]PYF78936.1 hypothetical protein DFP75_11067 [Marinomonas alcarazii]
MVSQEKAYGEQHPNYSKNRARMKLEECSHYKATPTAFVSVKKSDSQTTSDSAPYINDYNNFTFDYTEH